MSDKKEYYAFTLPLSPARYPKLLKQDTYEGKEVGYKCGQALEGKALAEVRKHVDAAIEKLAPGGVLKKGKQSPLREDSEGNSYFEAKSYKKVALFAAKGNKKLPEDTNVGSGSTIRMKVAMTMGNGHLVAYINGIQVAKLVEGNSEGFDDVEGDDFDTGDDEGFEDTDGDNLDI